MTIDDAREAICDYICELVDWWDEDRYFEYSYIIGEMLFDLFDEYPNDDPYETAIQFGKRINQYKERSIQNARMFQIYEDIVYTIIEYYFKRVIENG